MVIEGGGYLRVTKVIFGEIIKLMTSLEVSFGTIKNYDIIGITFENFKNDDPIVNGLWKYN